MKFKVGDRVKVVGEKVEDAVKGAIGTIVEVDPEWAYPYYVKYEDKDLDFTQDLFCDDDLELIDGVGEDKPKKVKELPTVSKLFLIRDLKGDGNTDGIRNASIIDLEKGVNRLNLRTNDVDDIIESIRVHKPSQIIFEIHDRKFKEMLLNYVNSLSFGFKIYNNGVVKYGEN